MRTTSINALLCLVSALIGAVAASIWWNTPSHFPQANAQEFRLPSPQPYPTQRSAAAHTETNRTPLAMGPAPTLEGAEELTPEERVNVAVYDSCNRSVVNI